MHKVQRDFSTPYLFPQNRSSPCWSYSVLQVTSSSPLWSLLDLICSSVGCVEEFNALSHPRFYITAPGVFLLREPLWQQELFSYSGCFTWQSPFFGLISLLWHQHPPPLPARTISWRCVILPCLCICKDFKNSFNSYTQELNQDKGAWPETLQMFSSWRIHLCYH